MRLPLARLAAVTRVRLLFPSHLSSQHAIQRVQSLNHLKFKPLSLTTRKDLAISVYFRICCMRPVVSLIEDPYFLQFRSLFFRFSEMRSFL